MLATNLRVMVRRIESSCISRPVFGRSLTKLDLATVWLTMPQRTDTFELAPLGLRSGDGRRFDLHVPIEAFHSAGEPYAVTPDLVPVRLDVSRTTGMGWALRLRF